MLIVVEGGFGSMTDKDFVELYCKYLGITPKKICQADGKYNVKSAEVEIHKALNMGERVLIIFDADDDIQKSLKNIHAQLDLLDSSWKNQCEIFLMPNNKDAGNLETLLENIAKEKCILKCFDNYIECIAKLRDKKSAIRLPAKKSKVFAYLSSFGFKNGDKNFKLDDSILDLQSPYLDNLKDFFKGTKLKIQNKH